jgi:hypothetical protein
MIPIITYTNSRCKDIWPIYFDLLKRNYGTYDGAIFSDEYSSLFNELQFVEYNNDDPFYKCWISYLTTCKHEYFIYMQEDFFLYNPPNFNLLSDYLDIIKNNPEISYIRLIKSGINSYMPSNINTLYHIDNNIDYPFSMQATIWNKESFLKIQNTEIQIKPHDEGKINYKLLNELQIHGLYHYDGENKRGYSHYDSNVFPYIATAIVKGKWNISEYGELYSILPNYNINIYERGIV